MDIVRQYLELSGFANVLIGNLIMIVVGCIFIYLAVAKNYEPLLLVPIGFGMLIGNMPIPIPEVGERAWKSVSMNRAAC